MQHSRRPRWIKVILASAGLVVSILLGSPAKAAAPLCRQPATSPGGAKGDSVQVKLAAAEVAIAKNPGDADAYCARGECWMNPKDCVAAMKDFTKALELQPDLVRAHEDRGVCSLRFRAYFGEYFESNTTYSRAWDDLTFVINAHPDQAQAYVHRAELTGSFDARTIPDCNKAIELDPKCARAYIMRACAAPWQDGHGADSIERKAIEELAAADRNKAIELEPDNPEWYFARAVACDGDDPKLIADAIGDIDRVLKLNPTFELAEGGDRNPYLFRADLHEKLGQWDLQRADFEDMIKAFPDRTEVYEKGVRELKYAAEHRAAAEALEAKRRHFAAAIAAEAERLAAPIALIEQKKYAEAVAEADKFIAANTADAGAHAVRGDALAAANDQVNAIAEYEAALKINPKCGSAAQRTRMLATLCNACASSNHYDKAVEWIDAFLAQISNDDVDPSTADELRARLVLQRGRFHVALKQFDAAVKDFSAFIAAEKGPPELYFERARALAQLAPVPMDKVHADFAHAIEGFRDRAKHAVSDAAPAEAAAILWNAGDAELAGVMELGISEPALVASALKHYTLAIEHAAKASAAGVAVPGYQAMLDELRPTLKSRMGVMCARVVKYESHEGAIACCTDWIAVDSELAAPYVARAQAHEHVRAEKDLAISDYKRALELQPGDSHICMLLGELQLDSFKYAAAIATLDHVGQDSPDYEHAQQIRKYAVFWLPYEGKPFIDDPATVKKKADADAARTAKVTAEAPPPPQPVHYEVCSRCGGARFLSDEDHYIPEYDQQVLVMDRGQTPYFHVDKIRVNFHRKQPGILVCPACNGTGWITY